MRRGVVKDTFNQLELGEAWAEVHFEYLDESSVHLCEILQLNV